MASYMLTVEEIWVNYNRQLFIYWLDNLFFFFFLFF